MKIHDDSCSDEGCRTKVDLDPLNLNGKPFLSFADIIKRTVKDRVVHSRRQIRSNLQYIIYLQYYQGEKPQSMTLEEIGSIYNKVIGKEVKNNELYRELTYLIMAKLLNLRTENGKDVYVITVPLIDGVESQILDFEKRQKDEEERLKREEDFAKEAGIDRNKINFSLDGWKTTKIR